MEMNGQSHALVPLDRRLSGPQGRSECGGEQKIPFRSGNPIPVAQPLT